MPCTCGTLSDGCLAGCGFPPQMKKNHCLVKWEVKTLGVKQRSFVPPIALSDLSGNIPEKLPKRSSVLGYGEDSSSLPFIATQDFVSMFTHTVPVKDY